MDDERYDFTISHPIVYLLTRAQSNWRMVKIKSDICSGDMSYTERQLSIYQSVIPAESYNDFRNL